MSEAESFPCHLCPVIIYSQMQEGSVLKIRWKTAICLLKHDLFLFGFSCTCWLQQETWAFTWMFSGAAKACGGVGGIHFIFRNPHRLSPTLIHTCRKLPLTWKLHDQVVNSRCGVGFCPRLHCCLKIKAEFSSEKLNFWFEHESEKHHPCFEPNLNVNIGDKDKKS